jgi:hypothetical protein
VAVAIEFIVTTWPQKLKSPQMNRLTLAASLFLFLFSAVVHGQSISRVNASTIDDAAKAIDSLKRLQQEVIVYRSLGEFEEGRKLARVPLQTFEKELMEVTRELERILGRLPEGKLKVEVTNSLACYRDGAFWWGQIDERRVISVAALSYKDRAATPANQALRESIPYTVVVNWRLASRYLNQAERALHQ